MTLPTLSVVIATYGRPDLLPAVLAAVLADPYPVEVVVVVDGCPHGSFEVLTKLAAGDRRIRPMWQENAGAAAARATGVAAAVGEVVLLLDDDVLVPPGLATGHARTHVGRHKLVVVGPLDTVPPARRAPGDVTTLLYAEDYDRARARYLRDPASVLPFLWAGNMSVRRADALRVGLASGHRLPRHNDQEFGLRCARAGLTGVFDPALAARHLHTRNLGSFARQCWQAGASRRLLGGWYPDLLPDTDPRVGLPAGIRHAVTLAAAPGVHWLARPVLVRGLRVAGSARLWPVETALARLLRQVELLRGYLARP